MKSSMLPFRRGLWVSGRKVSKLFFLLFLSCLFAFNSCTNIFETSVEETTEEHQEQPAAGQTPAPIVTQPSAVKVSFSGSLSMRGAVPSQIDQAVANQNTQELETSYQEELEASLSILQRLARAVRSASPSVAAGGNYEFFVRAFTNDGTEPQEVTPTQDASGQYTYAFLLEPGHIWYFTAGFRRNAIGIQGQTGYEPERILMLDLDSQRNAPFYHDFTNMDDLSSQHTFILGPVQSEEGKGSLNLELTVDTSKVDNFKLFIPDATDGHPVEWNADGKVHITEDGTTTGKWYIKSDGLDSESHNVPSGTYNLSIIFYKQFIPTGGSTADAYNTPVYISYQTINVFDNMTTNLWMNENDDSSSASTAINKTTHAFNVSQTLVENFTNTSLYVGRPVQSNITPNDEAVGGPFSPLATLEQAFNLIEARGRGAPYRIYVSGTQEGSFTVPAAITSAMASSIEITTASGNPQATLDAATTGGSVLTVNSAVPLKISNLKITGGNAGSGNGGGINIPSTNTSARVTLDTGALITGNSAAHGDGVYVGGGSLILQGSPKVEEDDDICLAAGKTITAKQLTGSEHIANITQENWTRHSTIITGSSLSNSVANRFNLTANADDEWQKIAAPNQITIYAPIYVGSGGDDSPENSGTKTHPFESFTRACGEMNDATKNWDININGTVNGAQTITAAVSSGAASITIQGVSALSGGNPQDKIDAGSNGSALTIATSVPVTIKKLLITGGNKSGDGGGINVTAANAELYLANDVQIYGNEATGNGGGINLGGAGAKLFMYSNSLIGEPGISITSSQQAAEADSFGNKAANGGGIYIGGSGAAAYIGATGLASNGAVVPEVTSGVFCKIYRNYSTNGGGIYNAAGIVKLCSKLNINYNRASDSGGGLYIGAGASESKSDGGSLYKNAAVNGGGLYICDGAAFTLNGGIGGNGSTYYNTATNGGAVYNAGTFKLESNAFLSYGYSAGTNDVYLANVGGVQKTITLLAANYTQYSTTSSNKIGVTIPDWKHGRGKQILSTDGVTLNTTLLGKFVTTESDWTISKYDDDSKAKIDSDIYVASEGTRYKTTGAPSDSEDTSGSKSHPFKTIAAACSLLEDSAVDYTIKIDGDVGKQVIPAELKADGSGTYKARSLTLSGANSNSRDIFNANSNGSALTVNSDVIVLLSNFTITGGNAENGGGINLAAGARLDIGTNTIIKGNNASANGGGIYVASGAAVYIHGSNIKIGNYSATADSIGETTLSDGFNTAVSGAGIYNAGTIRFGYRISTDGALSGVSSSSIYIKGNTASGSGGAIYNVDGGSLSMSGSFYLQNNYAAYDGGGLYNDGSASGTNNLSLTIENNKANRDGGGIYIASGKQFDVSQNSIIKSNVAVNNGGAVYNAGTLNLYKTMTCTGNSANNGGAIYNAGSCDFSYGSIGAADAYNTAGSEGKGGAVYVCSASTFKMSSSANIPFGNAVNTNDVYLEKTTSNGTSSYATISVMTNLSTTTVATVTPAEWKRGIPIISSASNATISQATANRFAMSQDNIDWDKMLAADNKSAYITMPVYVASSASDDTTRKRCNPAPDTGANGTASKPYATIAAALAEFTDSSAEAEITIDGNVIGAQTIGTVTASKLTLTGYIDTANGATASLAQLNGNNVAGTTTLTVNAATSDFPVIINNLTVTGGTAANGAGINIAKGTVKLTDGAVITGNSAAGSLDDETTGNGGGVYVGSNGILFMYGKALIGDSATATGQASSNEAYRGAGIYNEGNVYIGYDTSSHKTPVYSDSSVSPAQYYGIRRNKTKNGGLGAGIYHKSGNLLIASGDISYNSSTAYGGGGALYSLAATSIMGGTITSNYAQNGGAIYVKASYVTLNGSELKLTGNQAALTGGAAYNEGTLTINGAEIGGGGTGEQNSAGNCGGAVYNANILNMGGNNVKINAGSEKTNDIYLAENKPLNLTNTLPTGAQIAITPWNFVRGNKLIRTSSDYADELAKFTVTKPADVTTNEWRLYKPFVDGTNRWARLDADLWVASTGSSSGRASSVSEPPATASERKGTKAKPYATIDEALAQVWDDGTNKTVDFTVNISGSLSDAQTIADTVTKAKSIKLLGDANAAKKEIDGGNTERASAMLTINSAVPVTITSLAIKNGNNTSGDGGGIYVSAAGASLTLSTEAVVSGNSAYNYGGGIYFVGTNAAGGTANLIMNSTATVSANSCSRGGGIYLSYANLCMSGSALIGDKGETSIAADGNRASNKATYGGGVYCVAGSNLYLGCNTSGETSSGGVSYALDSDCGIRHNYASASGGGVDLHAGSITFKSGTISYNSTHYNWDGNDRDGGGIWQNSGTTITMSGGTIAKNQARNGGGVYTTGSFTMSGGTIGDSSDSIDSHAGSSADSCSNYAYTDGGGIYAPSGATINISGGYINYNTCYNGNGGGIYFGSNSTSLNISGGNIEYNYADDSGGGIYLGKSASLTGPTDTQIAAGASPLEISYNYAVGGASNTGGGGIASFTSEFSLQNATMKGNKVSSFGYGGAILLSSASENRYVSMSGNISIPDASDKNNDILLGHNGTSNYNYINVNGALGGSGIVATLHQDSSVSTSWQVVDGSSTQTSAYYLPKVADRFEYITTGSEATKKYVVDGAGKPLQLNSTFGNTVPIGAFVIDDIDKGYWISKTATLTEALKEKICAVIFYNDTGNAVNNGGLNGRRILGIGLKSTAGPLFSNSSSGYVLADFNGTVCEGLVCTPSAYSGNVTFEGTRNGSASYTYVSQAFGDMSEANYPALYFAYYYAGKDGTHVPSNGYYYRNWYIPSIAEVYQLFQNKTTVEASLQKVLGTDATLGDSVASSSQKSDAAKSIFSMNSSGDIMFSGISLAYESTFFWPIHEF